MKTMSILSIILSFSSFAEAASCIDFPATYHCTSENLTETYDVSLILNATTAVPTYTITEVSTDGTKSYTLSADGNEVQLEGSANYSLFKSATCNEKSLEVNMREIVTHQDGLSSKGTTTSVYQPMAEGKILLIDKTATIDRVGPLQTTVFCTAK